MTDPDVSLLERLETAVQQRTLVKLILSAPPRSRAVVSDPSQVSRYTVRPITLKGGPRLQWTARAGTQERHENLTLAESRTRLVALFPREFREVNLLTTSGDFQFRSRDSQKVQVSAQENVRRPLSGEHNRTKQYLIPEGQPCAFLEAIGVMTAEGRVRSSMQHKFHQINRFLELVNDIVPHLPTEGILRVVDFGSGKSYLTFALHHLLTQIHRREVRLLAIDQNAPLLATCRGLCERLAITEIEFRAEAIGAVQLDDPVDLAVALHACDIATDQALTQAVRWQAKVILAAPCCQHEVAKSMTADSLQLILKHGILKERFAALVTDALRAEALENAGYRTQILEFVDLDHTPKNLLLRAVKTNQARPGNAENYSSFKTLLGLAQIAPDRIDPGIADR